jgi:hypothetical protein
MLELFFFMKVTIKKCNSYFIDHQRLHLLTSEFYNNLKIACKVFSANISHLVL